MSTKRVGLAQAIGILRDELAAAQQAGQGHQFRFEVSEAEVELLVSFDTTGGGEAGATFGVVSAGVDGKVSAGNTHRLLLKLKVTDAALDNRNLEISRDQAEEWNRE
jgi:hypothetical protein